MKPQTILIACLAFAACGFAFGSELQPVQAGIARLKSRLAEVKAESVSLRTALAAAEPTERPRLEGQLPALQEEGKRLAAEIESAERQSRSPYVIYAAPPPHEAR